MIGVIRMQRGGNEEGTEARGRGEQKGKREIED